MRKELNDEIQRRVEGQGELLQSRLAEHVQRARGDFAESRLNHTLRLVTMLGTAFGFILTLTVGVLQWNQERRVSKLEDDLSASVDSNAALVQRVTQETVYSVNRTTDSTIANVQLQLTQALLSMEQRVASAIARTEKPTLKIDFSKDLMRGDTLYVADVLENPIVVIKNIGSIPAKDITITLVSPHGDLRDRLLINSSPPEIEGQDLESRLFEYRHDDFAISRLEPTRSFPIRMRISDNGYFVLHRQVTLRVYYGQRQPTEKTFFIARRVELAR